MYQIFLLLCILRAAKGQNLQLLDDILIIDNSVEQIIAISIFNFRLLYFFADKVPEQQCCSNYYYNPQYAQELQMNPQTVKTRLRRGREVLKKFLIEEGYGSNAD